MATDPSVPLAELELRFAQQPNSDAFIPLARAYLDQGRLMEASVVCKKGLKSRPDSVAGRMLLVTVLSAQKKSAKADAELDGLIEAHPAEPAPRLERARRRLARDDRDGAREDLDEVLRADPSQPEANALMREHGLAPEPPPAPAPPMPARKEPVAVAPAGLATPAPEPSGLPRPTGSPSAEPGAQRPPAPPVEAATVSSRPRMRLEGEDELEALAERVAEERPASGRPIVTVLLLVVLVAASAGFMGWRYLEKTRIEAIDQLTAEAMPAFEQDTYGGYQRAAQRFEDILRNHDAKHALSLGRLAHSYAILWGEHGDNQLQDRLQEVLERARKHAAGVSHTVAAEGLTALYGAEDRTAGMAAAMEVLEPRARRLRDQGVQGTVIDVARGVALTRGGEYDEAFDVLSGAERSMPSSIRSKVWLGVAARRGGRLSQAIRSLREALRLQPDHPGAIAHLALTQLERGRLQGAMEQLVRFDEVARSNPKNISPKSQALAEYARSEIARSAGEEAKGVGAYELAVRLDPENSDFPFGLGRWLLKHQRPEEAIEPLEQAAKMEPDRPLLQVTLAEALMETERFDVARTQVEAALSAHPDFVPALLSKARLLRRTGDPGAEAFLQKLVEEHPTAVVDVKLELGRLYRARGRLDEAQAQLEAAIERMGSRPKLQQAEVLLAYGRLMERRRDWETAANAYEKSAEMGELEAHFRLSKVAIELGDRKTAERACTRYLRAGSNLRYSEAAKAVCDEL
jgi:cellulose synthase operon protein C